MTENITYPHTQVVNMRLESHEIRAVYMVYIAVEGWRTKGQIEIEWFC